MIEIFKPRWSFRYWLKLGLVIATVIAGFSSYVGWQLVRPAGRGEDNISVMIEPGETVAQISRQLKTLGLIRSELFFAYWVRLSGREDKIVSGYYSLPANVHIINLTYLLTSGVGSAAEVKIRLIEGWTLKQIAEYLEREKILKADDFVATVTDPVSVKAIVARVNESFFLSKPAGASLEGYLFPDTYRIYYDASAEAIAVKMLANLYGKIPANWISLVNSRGYSLHEALTLASIVEKEVPGDQDRKLVADIFWRRLGKGIGLQADSTINYVTGKSDQAASSSDLQIDSAYNTYKYRGLPPGPISNPSLSALEAVIFPETNDYWYFLTTSEGAVIYSRTFEEHRAAKARYLQ